MKNYSVQQFATALELERFLNSLTEYQTIAAITETTDNFTVVVVTHPPLPSGWVHNQSNGKEL